MILRKVRKNISYSLGGMPKYPQVNNGLNRIVAFSVGRLFEKCNILMLHIYHLYDKMKKISKNYFEPLEDS